MTRPWAPVQTKTVTRPAPAGPVSPFTAPPAPSPFTSAPVQVFSGSVSAFTTTPAAFTKPGGGTRPPFRPPNPFRNGKKRPIRRRFSRDTIIIPEWRPGRSQRGDGWIIDYFDIVDSDEDFSCQVIAPSGWIDLTHTAAIAYEYAVDAWVEERMVYDEDEDMLEMPNQQRRRYYAEEAEDVLPTLSAWYFACVDDPTFGHLHPYPAHWVTASELPLAHRQSDYYPRMGCQPRQATMWLELLPVLLDARTLVLNDPVEFAEAVPERWAFTLLMDALACAGCELPVGLWTPSTMLERVVIPALESGDETFTHALADLAAGWHPERYLDIDPTFSTAAAAIDTLRRHTSITPGHPDAYQFFWLPPETWPRTDQTMPALGTIQADEIVYHSTLADLDFQAEYPGVLGWGEARCRPREGPPDDDDEDDY